MIKAIPVKYKGVTFKSKLEARWAIFFDSLHVEWNYELESFELPTKWYIPDFWLPEWKVWFEVKPSLASIEEKTKARELCEATGYTVLISEGAPSLRWQGTSVSYYKVCPPPEDYFNEDVEWGRHSGRDGDIIFDKADFLEEDRKFLFSKYPDGDNDNWLFLEEWNVLAPIWRDADGIFHTYKIRRPFIWGPDDLGYVEQATDPRVCEWYMKPHVDWALKAQFDNKGRYIPI